MKRFFACLMALLLLTGCAAAADSTADLYPYDLSQYIEPADGPVTVRGWKNEVTDADVEQQVLLIRSRYSELKAVTDRGAGDMDYLILTYECRIDGKLISEMSETEAATVLGSGAMLPEIEKALYGTHEGDSFFVNVTLPDPYKANVSYSGKTASFHVTVEELDEQSFRPYDDENVQKISDYKTTAELEAAIREALLDTQREQLYDQLLASAWTAAADGAVVHGYPEEELNTQYEDAISLYEISAERAGMTLAEYCVSIGYEDEASFKAYLREKVEEKLRDSMLTVALARKYGITLFEKEYKAGAAAYAESLELTSVEVLELIYEKSEIAETLLRDKVEKYLLENAEITDWKTGEKLLYADLFPEEKTGLAAGWYVLIAAGAAAVITAAVLLVCSAVRKRRAAKAETEKKKGQKRRKKRR
ncbi:MAG: hypothetical protein MJ088_03515 [Clostridia bacterium]|nr:hypothetical protein [Clostridia bacterium]